MAKKSVKEQFVKLDYTLLHSAAWKGLSLYAREIYIQMKASRNLPNSRGRLRNTADDCIFFGYGDSHGMSKPTLQKGIGELVGSRFILVVDEGQFPNKKGVYALSDKWKFSVNMPVAYPEFPEKG